MTTTGAGEEVEAMAASLPSWRMEEGEDLLVATALHAGHALRPEVEQRVVLPEADRFREEDPHTDQWVDIATNWIVVDVSRFEVDLNRPRESAVYQQPEDAWNLDVWAVAPPEEMVARSLEAYDRFYRELGELCDGLADRHERFAVLDIHSYNHRRRGAEAPVDDPVANPEVNVGTGSVDRSVWASVIDGFIDAVSSVPFDGGHLDVRENVRFQGGNMSRWLNARYGDRGVALAIEVKKIYMDEWTGEADESVIVNIGDALRAGAEAISAELS